MRTNTRRPARSSAAKASATTDRISVSVRTPSASPLPVTARDERTDRTRNASPQSVAQVAAGFACYRIGELQKQTSRSFYVQRHLLLLAGAALTLSIAGCASSSAPDTRDADIAALKDA